MHLLPLLATVVLAHGGSSLQVREQIRPEAPDLTALVAEGDALHARLQPRRALELYQRVVEHDSTHYEALWKSSREGVHIGMLLDEGQKEWFSRAEGWARSATEADPDDPEGHHWLAVSIGRRALLEGIRTRVRLAGSVRDASRRALALDSLHAGAHHVLGAWHAEIRRLNAVERFVARRVLGADAFEEASWEEAEFHLRRAVELAPGGLIHHLELARLYLDTDRPGPAREHLRAVLDRPIVEPTDPLHKQEAQELLRDLAD